MANLIPPPSAFTLPVSKGGDLVINFEYTDGYPDGAEVVLIIEPVSDDDDVLESEATISDEIATVIIESEVADALINGQRWRAVYRVGTLDVVMCNGKLKRFDG